MLNKTDQLKVLQEAHQLTLKVYKLTKTFPLEERFRLVDQLCRAASSVPANIAEGNSRQSKKEFIQFLYQAKGSLTETQYHLLLARDLHLIPTGTYKELLDCSDKIGKMLSGLVKYLKSTSNASTTIQKP